MQFHSHHSLSSSHDGLFLPGARPQPAETLNLAVAPGFPDWHTMPAYLGWWPAHKSLPYPLGSRMLPRVPLPKSVSPVLLLFKPSLATTCLRSQHAQGEPVPFRHRTLGKAASIVAGMRTRCELRQGQQDQKRLRSAPATCNFSQSKWSVNPKPHSHIVESRLKYTGRQMTVWTMIIHAGTSTMKTIWKKKKEIIITCASWDGYNK